MRSIFPSRSLTVRSLLVPFAFSILASIAIARYFGQQQHPAGTETSWITDDNGNRVQVDSTYDDNGRVTERKEYGTNGKLRKRITHTYLTGFREPNTSITEYRPNGQTPEKTTSYDSDKNGNLTSTVTTNYDEKGNEAGGTKREWDPKTGKARCYNWDAKKQMYEEAPCPQETAQSQPLPKPSPGVKFTITDRDTRNNTCTCGESKTPCPCPSPSPAANVGNSQNARVETGGGLQTVIFDAPPGQIRIYLPDDMMAGDTISGSVVAEPKGRTEDERSRNQKTLNSLFVNLAGNRVPVTAKRFKLSVPGGETTAAPGNAKLGDFRIIIEPPGSQEPPVKFFQGLRDDPFFFDIPAELLYRSAPRLPQKYAIPPLGQEGHANEILCSCDGDFSTTDVIIAGQNVQKLAESPRKVVFQSPLSVTGPTQIVLKEGTVETKGAYRNVGVNLSAPKTNLMKGERTTLTVQVAGLQGIKEPVPLTLMSQGVITMEGGMFQPLMIQPSQVGADGRYTTTRDITGVQTGGWTATATVVTQPFNIVLRDPDPPQTFLINSFTGDYVFCGSGFKLSGTGEIKRKGCVITLTHNEPDRRVMGTVDSCVPVDVGRFFVFHSAGTNTDIQVTVTGSQPPKRTIYFNPLDRPRPPVQDVSAFATCP